MARRVGATHVVNSAGDDPVAAIRALTAGAGVDHAFARVSGAHYDATAAGLATSRTSEFLRLHLGG